MDVYFRHENEVKYMRQYNSEMGGAASSGVDNDDLIDILMETAYLRSPTHQRVFRAVDRGHYYTPSQRSIAYRDTAWRCGNLHLSSPCVYSEVIEALKLKKGHSFLNLGSGSGYFSTLAGLILGPYGINHGIEIYSDVLDFANNRLDDFLSECDAVDAFEFCEPSFQLGNCLHIDDSFQLYDRVYCGAACPEKHRYHMMKLIKIGGILVLPVNNRLVRITRTSEATWESRKLLAVSFAPLVCPPDDDKPKLVKLPDFTPPLLQEVCRSMIRTTLRDRIDKEYPGLKDKRRNSKNESREEVQRLVIPLIDSIGSSSSNSRSSSGSDDTDTDPVLPFIINSGLRSKPEVHIQNFMQQKSDEATNNAGPSNWLRSRDKNKDEVESAPEQQPSKRTEDSDSDLSSEDEADPGQKFKSEKSQPPLNKRRRRRLADTFSRKRRCFPKLKLQGDTATFIWKGMFKGLDRNAPPPPPKPVQPKEQKTVNGDEVNYKNLMLQNIQCLPLPLPLKRYMNYRRKNI